MEAAVTPAGRADIYIPFDLFDLLEIQDARVPARSVSNSIVLHRAARIQISTHRDELPRESKKRGH